MTTLDTLLEEIRIGPSGVQIAAFFDFDGTLAHLVLRPFLDAYSVVAEQLATADGSEEVDELQFLAGCIRVGRQVAAL